MNELISSEQKNRLFEKLIVSASCILSEELGLPLRTFEEIRQLIEESGSCPKM